MPRASKLLTDEQKAIAEENGIPLVTVYKRLDRDWDVEKAITKPTRKPGNVKRKDGLFVDAGRAKARFFSLPVEWDEKLTQAIAESELSESEWIEQTIIDKLKAQKKAN
ncbi:MAG: hypothetical protein SWZ49_23575 [Cyanobacteriota bacterium]|nr:hypothetical protein [Cyanobacteriota bacterium]